MTNVSEFERTKPTLTLKKINSLIEKINDEKRYLVKQDNLTKFNIEFKLPKDSKAENVIANYTDGILTIKIEKDLVKMKSRQVIVE